MLKYLLFVETNFQQTITYFLIGHWCIAIVQLAKIFKLVEYKVAEDVNTQVKYLIIVLNLPVYREQNLLFLIKSLSNWERLKDKPS